MPGHHITIRFSEYASGRPYIRNLTYKMEPPPNFAPSRDFDRHIDCYLPRRPKINLTIGPKSRCMQG